MGNNCCQRKRVKRKKIALLLVGLDNAGKTLTAKGLAGETLDCPVPTIGFSVIELKYLHYNVKIYDLGGGVNIRGIWHKYFVDVHGIIYVVDSCDFSRFGEVKEVLKEILSNDKIAGKPLLILANKQDKESALDEIDLIECLKIEQLANRYRCPTLVQCCSANERNYNKPDLGIQEGYEWIVKYIDRNYENLNIRVQIDVVEQELKEKEELLAKIQKIKAEREALSRSQDPDAIETYSEYVSKLNEEAVKEIEVEDFDSNLEDSGNSGTNTSHSSITFPAIYHINNISLEKERPKSAIEIVRHQLQMKDYLRRSYSAKTKRNKTAPVKLFKAKEFMPNSGNDKLGEIINVKPQRVVRTADERIFTISNEFIGPGGDHYRPNTMRETFQIDRKLEIKSFPSSKVRSKAQINQEGERNGIFLVDVD